MLPHSTVSNIEIKDRTFTTGEGRVFPRTADLLLTSPDGHHDALVSLGYLDQEEIFQIIENNDPLILDECYVDNFSLESYRQRHKLEQKKYVTLNNFSARGTYFNCRSMINLEYVDFRGEGVSFAESHIARACLNLHASKMSGGLDLSDSVLEWGELNLTNILIESGDVNFKNAIFGKGLKDFQDAEFGPGNILFANCDFGDGDVSFVNTRFGDGNVSFKVARFGKGKVDFHYAKFGEGDISFERTDFGDGRVDFRTVEFVKGRVNFNRSVFGSGDVTFEASEFRQGKISFKRTEFGEGKLDFELAEYDNVHASFDRAVLDVGTVSFHKARFNTLSLQSCHFDHYLDLRVASCRHIDLSDSIARDIIDLKPYDFDLDIGTIDFSGIRLIGRIYIDWERNKVKKLIKDQIKSSNRSKAEQFRTLKENFNVTGHYNDEDRAYLEFKRHESDAILEESLKKKKISAIWMYPAYWFKLVFFDWVGHYATNPLRVITSMLAMYLLFSFVFMLLTWFTSADIVSSIGDPDKLNVVVRSLYHSAITFLTIGYGDYYPSGFIRWFSGFVGLAGLIMISYFTVAFVRKILR